MGPATRFIKIFGYASIITHSFRSNYVWGRIRTIWVFVWGPEAIVRGIFLLV